MKRIIARIGALRRPALEDAIFLLLAVALPAVLPFIRRATPVLLVAGAMLCAVRIARRRTWAAQLRALPTWPVLVCGLFLLYAAVTLFWTPAPARRAHALFDATLIFTSAAFLFGIEAPLGAPARQPALALALSFAALVISLDLTTGARLIHLIHERPEPYRYNMVLVSLIPLSFGLFRDRLSRARRAKLIASALLFNAIWLSESETAKLAAVTGIAAMALAVLIPRGVALPCFALGVIGASGALLCAPELARGFTYVWPRLASGGHVAERIDIWSAFSKLAFAGLPWGWGVESVAFAPMTSFYAHAPEALQAGLRWMHPHNNILQIATETGLPGLVLALAASVALILWAHSDEAARPARTGLTASVFVVAFVSHGFWQMWWWSAVAIGMWMLNGPRPALAPERGSDAPASAASIRRPRPAPHGGGKMRAARRSAHLLLTLVRTELVSTYRRTFFGGVWALVNPLVSMTLYWVVFSTLMAGKISGDLGTASYAAFLCSGMVSWFLLADMTSRAKDSLIAQADLAKKSSIPVLYFPLASCLTALFNFALLAIFLLAAQAVTDGSKLQDTGLWLLILIPSQFFFVLTLSLVLAVTNVYMRDIGAFYAAALQLWFWCTPVVYPLKSLPDWARPIVELNPMTVFVQNFQRVIAFGEPPVLTELAMLLAGASLFLIFATRASRVLIADAKENL